MMNNRQVPNLSQYPMQLFQQGYQPGVYYNMYDSQLTPWVPMQLNIPLLTKWGTMIGDALRLGDPRTIQSQGNAGSF